MALDSWHSNPHLWPMSHLMPAPMVLIAQVAKSVDMKSELMVWFRLIVVDVSEAKSSVMAAALAARAALQEWVEGCWHDANQAIVARWVCTSLSILLYILPLSLLPSCHKLPCNC